MNLVNDILIEQPFHVIIGNYLNSDDNKKILLLNKSIFNNRINRMYYKEMINTNSKKIKLKFMRRYLNYSKYISNLESLERLNLITKKINASYYFKFYDKIYINNWYNNNTGFKKSIVDMYKTKDIVNPTRLDLFNLINRININD